VFKKYLIVILFLINIPVIYAQEDKNIDFSHRITLGAFYSYTNDNIGILEPKYDFIINFPYINPNYNILDFGIGLSMIMAFDGNGNVRIPVFGFALNGSMRLYTSPMAKARLYAEGAMGLVFFTRSYPENGTMLNGSMHVGGGFEYNLENNTKLFFSINWFHISNNDVYGRERNPGINSIGLLTGLQL
jgi:hypothetical protein